MLHSHKPYRLLSDERLARLAAGRDDRAFSSLYQRHERALLAYCRSITRDGEDARDALQSAITAAYAAAPGRGHGSGPVRAWLFRIAHNESVNVLRRRRPDLPLVDTDLTPAPSAADQTTQRETAHEALAVVAQLPPRQRGALVLRELHGLDYGEIAAALSVTEVNARQLVFAARNGVAASRAGAALPCDLVRDAIEAGDRRAQRRRPLRAHLRTCDECRAFARVSRVRPRRALLAVPGGWLAGWTPFVNGGSAAVSGSGEVFTPAKAVAVVAIAAAATGAAAHDPPRPGTPAKAKVASIAHPAPATGSPKTSESGTRVSAAASAASASPTRASASRTTTASAPGASTRSSPAWRGATPPSRGTSTRGGPATGRSRGARPPAPHLRHAPAAAHPQAISAPRDGSAPDLRSGDQRNVAYDPTDGRDRWRTAAFRDGNCDRDVVESDAPMPDGDASADDGAAPAQPGASPPAADL